MKKYIFLIYNFYKWQKFLHFISTEVTFFSTRLNQLCKTEKIVKCNELQSFIMHVIFYVK